MKIDNSKSVSQTENVRNKQAAGKQNNLDENFQTDNMDAPYGEFASIFESLVNREKDKDTDDEKSTSESKLDDSENDNSSNDHKRVSEKKENNDSETGSNAESNAGMAAWRLNNPETQVANLENINARAILHIADIEKIVSSIRTQLSDINTPQIVIQLKNSVLEGLQIKLSTDANGKIIAEFVSKSEKARLQVEAKSKELAEILQNRGIQLASIKTSLADSSTENQNNQNKKQDEFSPAAREKTENNQVSQMPEIAETAPVSVSNSYRV